MLSRNVVFIQSIQSLIQSEMLTKLNMKRAFRGLVFDRYIIQLQLVMCHRHHWAERIVFPMLKSLKLSINYLVMTCHCYVLSYPIILGYLSKFDSKLSHEINLNYSCIPNRKLGIRLG